MAAELQGGRAFVDVLPDLTDFGRRLKTGVGDPIDATSQRVSKSLGGTFTKLAGLAGGLFAGKALLDFGKNAFAEATESNKIGAQTGAVIKSTGAAAKVTAEQVGDLADAIAAKTGIDDGSIAKAENLLLTFTNLRNETGKGNDIFSQATKVAVDMGAALGGDASSNAIQLGKALNDPIKGLVALTRVGVTFTAEQKAQVAALQASGDMLGAQKIILAELNKEFGGSAEAQATAAGRLKVIWGNIQEDLGQKIVPIVEKVATFLADRLPGAIDVAGKAFGRLRTVLIPIFDRVKLGVDALIAAFREGDVTSDGFVGFMETIGNAIRNLMPTIERVAGFVRDHFKPILIGLGIVIAAIAAPVLTVAAALVFAYSHFQTFRNVVNAVAAFLVNTVAPAIAAFVGGVVEQFSNLVEWFQEHWAQISEAISHVVNVIAGIIRTYIDIYSALWRAWGDDLIGAVKTVWNFIQETIDNALQLIRGVITTVVALINGDWGAAWDGLKGIVGAVWDQIGNIISTAVGLIKGIFGGFVSTIAEVAKGMWNPILDGLKWVLRGVIQAWNAIDLKIPKVHIPGTDVDFGGVDLIPDFNIPGFLTTPAPTAAGTGARAMAGGGHFDPRELLRVGEKGAELVRFDRPGTVIPASVAGTGEGLSQILTFEINNPVPEPATESIPRAVRLAAVALGSR